MKITIIDGQGGKIGKSIIEQLKKAHPEQELYAIGTNALATAAMLKAGADYGATGENPCIVNAADSDIIIGPIGIVIADAMLGEITPQMAVAVGQAAAIRILLPVNKCDNLVAGITDTSMATVIEDTVLKLKDILK